MDSATGPGNAGGGDILSKIHKSLSDLSSLPHTHNNPQHPNPNFHLDIFGRPRYTRIRRVRRPDGQIVDEDWKAPRVGKPWPPPPREYIKPSKQKQTLDQSSPQHQKVESLSHQRVELNRAVHQGDSMIVSQEMIRQSAQERATEPAGAMDPTETDSTDLNTANGVEDTRHQKHKAKPGTDGILFPRREEMPGYIPPHLRPNYKAPEANKLVTTPDKPSSATNAETRESSPGLESSRWAPENGVRATAIRTTPAVKQPNEVSAETRKASGPAAPPATPAQGNIDNNTMQSGGRPRLRILRITNNLTNGVAVLGGHNGNWSSNERGVTEILPAAITIPTDIHKASTTVAAPITPCKDKDDKSTMQHGCVYDGPKVVFSSLNRSGMGRIRTAALSNSTADVASIVEGKDNYSNSSGTAQKETISADDTIQMEKASTPATALTILTQSRNDALIPISPTSAVKPQLQNMPKKDSPPVSTMVFNPVAIKEAAPLARDQSLGSEPANEDPKAGDRCKQDTWKEGNWAQNKPQRKSAWAKIPNAKHLAEYVTKDDDGWDPPFRVSDPNDVSHLLDWKGDWLPAPADWEGRTRYADGDEIKKWALWVDNTEHALTPELKTDIKSRGSEITVTKNVIQIDHPAYRDGKHEIVPRYWIPEKIEAQSLQAFFTSFTRSSSPPSFEEAEEDPPSAPQWTPFWARYRIDGFPYNELVPVPDYQMDEKDDDYKAYVDDTGTPAKIKKYVRQFADDGSKLPKKRKQGKTRKLRGGFNRAPAIAPVTPLPDSFEITRHSSRLKVNIYLRIAMASDDRQIADIYNYYVVNTVQAAELRPRPVAVMYTRRALAENNDHKCIVAVEKTNGWKKSGGARGGPTLLSMEEKIVGFAMADDFTASDSMYRYTAEMELFVHPEYVRKGVGSALLDRMVFLLDLDHKISTSADWREKTVDLVNPGSIRYTKNITMSIPFVFEEDDERMRWIEAWLNSFGFHKKGEWDRVGLKLNKWYVYPNPFCFQNVDANMNCRVSLALFQKRTGASVNPRNAL